MTRIKNALKWLYLNLKKVFLFLKSIFESILSDENIIVLYKTAVFCEYITHFTPGKTDDMIADFAIKCFDYISKNLNDDNKKIIANKISESELEHVKDIFINYDKSGIELKKGPVIVKYNPADGSVAAGLNFGL